MNDHSWEHVQAIADTVIDLSGTAREARLLAACGGDKELEGEVRQALAAAEMETEIRAGKALPRAGLGDSEATVTGHMGDIATFGHYTLIDKIGVGGMGIVHKAIDNRLEREVALKFLSPQFCDDKRARSRFLAEAKAISKMDHPNICSIYDIGETDDRQLYFAMPLYEGKTLEARLDEGHLELHEGLEIMLQLCCGMGEAHSKELVHRDLKPANVFICDDGTVKILDFGVAKVAGSDLTLTGQAVGTVSYMSPQQVQGEVVDRRADIWSLGVLFYEFMTSRRPFRGKSHLTVYSAILCCEPAPIDEAFDEASPLLNRIAAKTLCLDPDARYQCTSEMIVDLEELQADTGTSRKDLPVHPRQGGVDNSSYGSGHRRSNSESLNQITRILEDYVGASARMLVNSLSEQTDTVSELCQRLGMEITDATHQREYFDRVAELTLNSWGGGGGRVPYMKDTRDPTVQLPAHRRGGGQRWLIGSAVLLLALVVTVLLVPRLGFLLEDQVEQIAGDAGPVRGVYPEYLLMGMSGPFSGAAKEAGRAMEVGLKARFLELNANGGIHGRELRLLALDDRYEPDLAVANLDKLLDKDEGVFALIGNVGTPTAKAMLPVVLEDRTLLFATLSGAGLLRENPPDRYVFNYRASYAEETTALVRYFVDAEGVDPKKIAVFHQDDSYGEDGFAGVVHALRRMSIRERPLVATYERNSTRVETAVEQLLANQQTVEAVIIIGSYKASARYTKMIRDGGYQGHVANVSFVGSLPLAEEFAEYGGQYGEGVLISQVVPYYDSYAAGVLQYREAMARYYPNEPTNFISLEGYIIASIFCEALYRAGRQVDTATVIDALHSIEGLDLGIGPSISFGPSKHQASHYVWGVRLGAGGSFEHIHLMAEN